MARILLVDDDLSIRTVISLMLSRAGHSVCMAASGEEALVLAGEVAPDLVLSDLCMPGINGDELLREIGQILPGTSCILMTGDGDERAGGAGKAAPILRKPFSCQELSDAVDGALGVFK